MNYYIDICGLKILMSYPYKLGIEKPYTEFVSTKTEENIFRPSISVLFVNNQKMFKPSYPSLFQYDFAKYYLKDDREVICTLIDFDQEPYAVCDWNELVHNKLKVQVDLSMSHRIQSIHDLFQMVSFEYILYHFNTFILHCSFVSLGENALLFSAPSGFGKSTQANLWKIYKSAEILNGDKAAIRKTPTGWKVYGLPMAGSSGIFKNQSRSLKAIIILRKGLENHVDFIPASEKLRLLYPELTIHRWNPRFLNKALAFLERLVGEVPIVLYTCLPDKSSVSYLEEALTSRGIL